MRFSIQYNRQSLEHLLTALFWILFLAAPFLFVDFSQGLSVKEALLISLPTIPIFLAFIINRLILLPTLYFKQRRREYVVAVIGLITVIALGKQMIPLGNLHMTDPRRAPNSLGPDIHPPPPLGLRGPNGREAPARLNRPFPNVLVFSFLSLMIIGVDTGLKSALKLSRKEREHTLLEKENVSNQLAFLRNQVSPHFFMNTLNNIHSLIDLDTQEAKEAIIKLSKLMRHLLYDSESEHLPLKKEIDFIRSYVELMKLRYSRKVDIVLETPSNIPDENIPPLLFTSILENAFKYGISYKEPSFINISLAYTTNSLTFQVRNSNHQPKTSTDYSGIGLQNTRKRLDLLYPGQYTLDVEDTPAIYTVNLHIPL
ncbi:MAG: histidine kinase [Bacteroidota bacterium]